MSSSRNIRPPDPAPTAHPANGRRRPTSAEPSGPVRRRTRFEWDSASTAGTTEEMRTMREANGPAMEPISNTAHLLQPMIDRAVRDPGWPVAAYRGEQALRPHHQAHIPRHPFTTRAVALAYTRNIACRRNPGALRGSIGGTVNTASPERLVEPRSAEGVGMARADQILVGVDGSARAIPRRPRRTWVQQGALGKLCSPFPNPASQCAGISPARIFLVYARANVRVVRRVTRTCA